MKIRLSILQKILALLSLLACVALVATVYSTQKMRLIDDTYGDLIYGPGKANLSIARANRALIYVNRSIFRLITEDTEAGIAEAETEITDNSGFFLKWVKSAGRAMPVQATELDALAASFNAAMENGCAATIALAKSMDPGDKKAAGVSMREQCDPQLHETMLNASAMTNRILDTNDESADAALDETNATIRFTYILVLGGLAVVLCIVAFGVLKFISGPLRSLTACMNLLANGEDDVEIAGRNRHDEIGSIAKAVETFRKNAAAKREIENAEARERAEKATARQAEVERIASEFEQVVGAIIETVGSAAAELEGASSGLSGTAKTTNELSLTVSSAAEQASANIQSVASATEELSSSVGEISGQVIQARDIASSAVKEAEATDARIKELSEASSRIGEAVKIIADIAEQTNLLALNATIEAARAGEAGKGFAVVASEVKVLASQTGKATEQIGDQITGIQHATADAVQAIEAIGTTISQMHEIAGIISAAVEEQGSTTLEISRNVHQTAGEAESVATNITKVTEAAQHTGSASDQLLNSARSLAEGSSKLRTEVSSFLTKVRAA